MNIISLGAGVQSTTMALMAAHGEIEPMPDCAIFADTQWEPKAIYDHLDWLESVVCNPLRVQRPFPIHRVTAGNIRKDAMDGMNITGQRFASMPFYLSNGGMSRRQCTKEYKITPIRRQISKLLGGAKKAGAVRQWIGISTDEASRMKPSNVRYIENVWPLIDAGMSRRDCINWFAEHYPGRLLEKSACIGCPYRDNKSWREMKLTDQVSWGDAVDFDKNLRRGENLGKLDRAAYLHRSRQPLSQVDLRNLEDLGQLNMFNDECEGMCGV